MKLLSLLLLLSAPSVTLASDEAMSRFSDLLRTLETFRNGERLIKRPTIFGSTIDISSLNSGDFYWVDGDGAYVGRRYSGVETDVTIGVLVDSDAVWEGGRREVAIFVARDAKTETLFIDPDFQEIFFEEEDCRSAPLAQRSERQSRLFEFNGRLSITKEPQITGERFIRSKMLTRRFNENTNEWIEASCENVQPFIHSFGLPIIDFIVPEEILTAVYPLRLMQKP